MAAAPLASAHVRIVPLDVEASPGAAIRVFARADQPAILESAQPDDAQGRFSIFTCEPAERVVFSGEGGNPFAVPLESLQSTFRSWPQVLPQPRCQGTPGPTGSADLCELPFLGGWIGYLAYEAGLGWESITPTGTPLSAAQFSLYDAAAILDVDTGRWYAVAVDWPEPWRQRRPAAYNRIRLIETMLREAVEPDRLALPKARADRAARVNMSREEYLAAVRLAKEHIAAGDVYQVNVTQRFTARSHASPLDHYLRLRELTPATHAALLDCGDHTVISASPELFLDVRGRRVITRPIKGTRPRGNSFEEDERLQEELARSEKDTAELVMIVDLLRNDLGRVCTFGSVRVTTPWEIETLPNVFHRVATIEGELRPEVDATDLLQATFPGGSITGAPKIRAMQVINALEPTPRGVYCGAIGYVGLEGSLSFSVAIRTMVQIEDVVHAYAGSGIVADSEPEAEYEECLAKAGGMLAAMGCGRVEEPQEPAIPVKPVIPS